MSGSDEWPVLTHDEVVEMGGAFVLGALEPAEAAAVRAHLATCPEDHAEIAELGSVLPVLAGSVPAVAPSAGLKGRIMAAACCGRGCATARPAAAGRRLRHRSVPSPAAAGADPVPGRRGARDAPARRTGARVLGAAHRRGRRHRRAWSPRTCLLRNQLDSAQAYEQASPPCSTSPHSPARSTAILTPDGGTGSGLAAVSAAGDVTLAMQDMAPTSGETVYTAWASAVMACRSPSGTSRSGSDGTATFSATTSPRRAGPCLR